MHRQLRQLPSVDELLRHPLLATLATTGARPLLVKCARETLETLRKQIRSGQASPAPDDIATHVERAFQQQQRPSLRSLINATGVIINTNLGRSPLSQES